MWAAADEWAKNSPYLARDILMASAMGTFIEGTMANGKTKVSLVATNATVQQLLDSIGFEPGTMLVRTNAEWQALLIGEPDQVLTIDPVTMLPDWADASGGGGGGAGHEATFLPAYSGTTAEAHASAGNVISPSVPMFLTSMTAVITTIIGGTYQLAIAPYDLETSMITEAPTIIGTVTEDTSTTARVITIKQSPQILLSPPNSYLLFATRTDATATTSTTFANTGSNAATLSPGLLALGGTGVTARVASSIAPDTTTLWTSGGSGCWCIGMTYALH